MLRIVKERCIAAGLPEGICNHTFRGTDMTGFLLNGGSLEAAQEILSDDLLLSALGDVCGAIAGGEFGTGTRRVSAGRSWSGERAIRKLKGTTARGTAA